MASDPRSSTAGGGDAAGDTDTGDWALARAWRDRDLTYALGPHFTLGELIASQVAAEQNVNNFPRELAHVVNLKRLVDAVLEPVRDRFGAVRVHSGYRCRSLNGLVGGVADSQHVWGEAADITVAGADTLALAHWIAEGLREFDQVILEPGWVHVSYRAGNLRRQALTMWAGRYTPGLQT